MSDEYGRGFSYAELARMDTILPAFSREGNCRDAVTTIESVLLPWSTEVSNSQGIFVSSSGMQPTGQSNEST
ncbi:MAG: hypothetical protein HKK66_10750 [Chlorobiaceae bacterium]|nr:hypothetical protein [Chlorobiaceae bacterium]